MSDSKVVRTLYAAVRLVKDSGREWVDLETFSGDREVVELKAADSSKACGELWATSNPVVRIARFRIEEDV